MSVIRLPFLWERVQPGENGPLSESELAQIDGVVTDAANRGMQVILDPHNFGSGYGHVIGSAETPDSAFADLWRRLASHFAGNGNVVFGLMNEPYQQTAQQWLASANAAIAAIRGAGARQEILVPGSYWDGAHSWVSSDNDTVIGTGVVDPLNNYAFEVHQYLDSDSSGTHASAVSASIGVERLTAITHWAEATHSRLFLGEFGAAQDPTSLTALSNMVAYMNAHPVWEGATYWAGGPWWGDYMYTIEPTGLGTGQVVDRPQMDVLETFLGGSNGTTNASAPTGQPAAPPGGDPVSYLRTGTDGADVLQGGAGRDTIFGYSGNDTISGGQAATLIFGNQGDDVLTGGQGFDTIFGGQGNDRITAGPAGGLMLGNLGNDTLYGGSASDTLFGGQGTDLLLGGSGDDMLWGDLGDDTLRGGTGADRFMFGRNSGFDIILDFNAAEGDRIDLQGQSYRVDRATDGSVSALLVLSGGGTIQLAGIAPAQVGGSIFA